MAWLIDTNGWINYLKGRDPALAKRLLSTNCDEVFVCSPVIAELLHGALKYGNPEARSLRVREALRPHRCLPFDEGAAGHYAEIRHDLETRGLVIGPFDMQIAAIARLHGLTLVTGNFGEFSRIPGLKIEDWSS